MRHILVLLLLLAAAVGSVQPAAAYYSTTSYYNRYGTTPPPYYNRYYTTPYYNRYYTTPYYGRYYTTPYYGRYYTTPYYGRYYTTRDYYRYYTTPYYGRYYTTPYYHTTGDYYRYYTTRYYGRYGSTLSPAARSAADGDWPCGQFEFLDKRTGRCVRCPFGQLARPFSRGCYKRLPVRVVLSNFRPVAAAVGSIDRRRSGRYGGARGEIPQNLLYVFASQRKPATVQRFLIWKRRGCSTRGRGYTAIRVKLTKGNDFDSNCWATDGGRYLSVACMRQQVMALELQLPADQRLRSCLVPAEVEVYGTFNR